MPKRELYGVSSKMQRRLDFGTPRTRHPNRHLGSGSGSNPLNGATLTVTLSSASPYINNNVTVTATLLDKNSNPLQGYAVTISITGITTASSNGTTNASGQTTYTYQSTFAGTDNASATSEGINSNTAVIVWSINFLLNDKFTDTDPAPITLPRTATPTGGETGSDASNLLSVGSDVLNVAADAGTPTVYLYGAQRARVAGLAAMWTINPLVVASTLQGRWGWHNVNNSNNPNRIAFRPISGSWFLIVSGSTFAWGLMGALANNTPETLAIVLFSNRNELYRLVAGSWRLVWVDYSNADANLYAAYGNGGSATQAHTQDNYRVAILGAASTALYTQLVGNISAGATSAARNGNCLIAFDLDTLPSAETIDIYFRKQDFQNYWLLRVSPTATVLREVVAGVETLRGSTSTPTTGKYRSIADGTTISVYDDNAQLFSYASASNFQNETAIEINSLGTGGAISDMDVYDRYGAAGTALDANLDATAAG